jgi:hypothetical protein
LQFCITELWPPVEYCSINDKSDFPDHDHLWSWSSTCFSWYAGPKMKETSKQQPNIPF